MVHHEVFMKNLFKTSPTACSAELIQNVVINQPNYCEQTRASKKQKLSYLINNMMIFLLILYASESSLFDSLILNYNQTVHRFSILDRPDFP